MDNNKTGFVDEETISICIILDLVEIIY